MEHYQLHLGDCLEALRGMPDNSVDSIVTDPPYGLSDHKPADVVACMTAWLAGEPYLTNKRGFMGKTWDSWVPGPEVWRECLRVLKPGGHVLAFAGSRTHDLMSMAMRLAGFECRDTIMYLYGSGFPKSMDVSKAIDKVNGEAGRLKKFTEWMRSTGLTSKQINDATGTFMGSHYLTAGSQPAIPTPDLWAKLRPLCGDVPEWIDELVDRIAAEREVLGEHPNPAGNKAGGNSLNMSAVGMPSQAFVTAPATDAARQWQGWGTALKPAFEPVLMFRKPLIGTVAENVLAHGTGALNIDGCRVAGEGNKTFNRDAGERPRDQYRTGTTVGAAVPTDTGRWPANLIHDGSDEVLAGFPSSASPWIGNPNKGAKGGRMFGGSAQNTEDKPEYRDAGSAARFFYCAKASKRDRDEGLEGFEAKTHKGYAGATISGRTMVDGEWVNTENERQPRANIHPTVKPTDLMAYLCRLVTPPGGTVLDPFMGSGSTGKAAMREGFRFIGCELSPEYLAIAKARISHELARVTAAAAPQPDLFSDA